LWRSYDPFRDKTIIEVADGEYLQLPDGLIDSDVEVAIKIKPEVYDVKIRHSLSTDIESD
jgi:hypothetical protein